MRKFFKRNAKNIVKWSVIIAVALIVYILAHKYATDQRGYEAVGGEIFLPLLIIFAEDILAIIKALFETKHHKLSKRRF